MSVARIFRSIGFSHPAVLIVLAFAGSANAAGLLRAPLVEAPETASKTAFISLQLRLETTPEGRRDLEQLPELSRLSELNLEGHWGAGALELLLRNDSSDMARRAAALAHPGSTLDDLRALDADLDRARVQAVANIREITKEVEEDLERTPYGIDDVRYLGLRADELAGLAVLDPAAKTALEKVRQRRDELIRLRAERVAEALDRDLKTSGADKESVLARRIAREIRAAGTELDAAPKSGDVAGAARLIDRLDWRGRLPTLRPNDPSTFYPPERPVDEPTHIKGNLSQSSDPSRAFQTALSAQQMTLSVVVGAVQEILPGFSKALLQDGRKTSAVTTLSMMLGLLRDFHLGFWTNLAESFVGLNPSGGEIREAFVQELLGMGAIDARAGDSASLQKTLVLIGQALRYVPETIVQLRTRRYRDFKNSQGLHIYPSLGF